MKYFTKVIIFALILTSALTCSVSAQTPQASAIPTISSYFDLLVSGNFESAGYLWTTAAQERATKLGIHYTGIPLKMDCTSPIVQDLNLMRNYLQPPIKRIENMFDDKVQKLYYGAVVNGKKVEYVYYAENDGRNYWLTYRQDLYSKDWEIIETEYFRLHVHPDLKDYLNPIMLEDADNFVVRIGDSLGLNVYDMRHLQSTKIEFFFCKDDDLVEKITGFRTRGMYDKASSDIISSFFPHYHEIAHLLVDYKMRETPLFVHPLFEEGIAVHYGGRWGKTADALIPLGIFLYEQEIVSLDTMLDYNSFRRSAEADIAYPLAGLFNSFLLKKMGMEKYLKMYRKFSGTNKSLMSLPVDSVKSYILSATSAKEWGKLVEQFKSFLTDFKKSKFVAAAGSSGKGETLVNGGSALVRDNGEWLEFEFAAEGKTPQGNLLFGKLTKPAEISSAMFTEHYENKVSYEGYRYGVRFDVNEAGLYDYATNVLLAKFISGIEKSDNYYNQENHKISFRLKKSLTNGVLPSENDYKLLDH